MRAISLYIGIPLLIVVAIIQSTVLPHIPVLGLVPSLTLLIVTAWSLQRGANEGMVWAAIGGLASDLASGAPIGISMLPLIGAALVAGAGHNRVFHGNVVLPALVSLLAIVLYQVVYLILIAVTSQPIGLPARAWEVSGRLVIVHMAMMPLAFFGVSWLVRLIEGPRVRLG